MPIQQVLNDGIGGLELKQFQAHISLIVLFIGLSLPARAGVVDFRPGPNTSGTSLAFTGGVITATTGGDPGPLGNVAQVVKRSTGLGVNNANINDTGAVQFNEFLIITFDAPTQLNDVIFTQIDDAGNRDSFSVFIDGLALDLDALLGGDIFTDIGSCITSTCTIDLSVLGVGTTFAFTDGSSIGIDGQGRRDNYSIGQISFTTPVIIAAPASFWLFILGVFSLGFLRRSRRASS